MTKLNIKNVLAMAILACMTATSVAEIAIEEIVVSAPETLGRICRRYLLQLPPLPRLKLRVPVYSDQQTLLV